jgi:hypothetical protein
MIARVKLPTRRASSTGAAGLFFSAVCSRRKPKGEHALADTTWPFKQKTMGHPATRKSLGKKSLGLILAK